MKETDIEKTLSDGIKKLGGLSYKFKSPGNSGVPDRIIILPDEKIYFVELKTKKGGLSSLQKLQIKRLKRLNAKVRVLYGKEDVKEFLYEITQIPRVLRK